jgi:hypothetical protein
MMRGAICEKAHLCPLSQNEWAPVHESIAGPYLRFSEGLLVQTSMISGSGKRVAFALQSRGYVEF